MEPLPSLAVLVEQPLYSAGNAPRNLMRLPIFLKVSLQIPTLYQKGYQMDKVSAAEKIEQILQQQINVMKEVYEYQKELSDSVRNRSWEGIERCVLKSTEASNEFLRLDKQCFLLLNQLDPYNEEVSDFYGYIALLPTENQKKLSHLYRSLQQQVQLSKTANDTLDAYVTHVQTLVQDMMDAAAIGTRTSFYTRTGAPSQSNYSSLVIDTVF